MIHAEHRHLHEVQRTAWLSQHRGDGDAVGGEDQLGERDA
jgi:hypothetical protein